VIRDQGFNQLRGLERRDAPPLRSRRFGIVLGKGGGNEGGDRPRTGSAAKR
jgi:hypothetical protein